MIHRGIIVSDRIFTPPMWAVVFILSKELPSNMKDIILGKKGLLNVYDYDRLYNSAEINMIIDNINEIFNRTQKGMLSGCHGRYHTTFVVDTVEYILKSMSYNARIIELGKIAALLHDIGVIAGRWNHARKSAALATVFLDDLEHITSNEKDTIIHAIKDHSDGSNISSVVGAALLIADKVDISKRRIFPDPVDIWHKNLLEVKNVNLNITDKVISINIITTEAFSKELISGHEKYYEIPIKAANFLNCVLNFQFNGVEE